MAHDPSSGQLFGKHICILTRRDLDRDSRIARMNSAFVDAGAKVSVVATTWKDDLPRFESRDGCDIYRLTRPRPKPLGTRDGATINPSVFGAFWRSIRGLFGMARMFFLAWRLNADAYHASDLQPLPVGWLVAMLRRRPLVYEAREISTDREAYQRFRHWVGWVEGFFARRASGFITTTGMRARHFVEAYGIPSPTVIQNRPVYNEPRSSQRLREALVLDEGAVLCLYQGGLQQGRGLPEILEAAVDVPGAHFVFLGDGNLRELLVDRSRQLNLQQRVHFLESVPFGDLSGWTASADIGLQLLQNTCLNHYTTDSNKLFEYAMAGLPVVASDFPEIRAVVQEWEFGMLVDPADRLQVVRALNQLVESAANRERLSTAARKAARNLQWQTQVPALIDLYLRVLSRP